jgi:mannose-6-phosphate isomerase-like protein (cupin superfamily)
MKLPVLLLAVASIATLGAAQMPGAHVMVQPDAIKWSPMSPSGLSTAIAEGNPKAEGPFTMMLKLRDGGWIAPHFHNVDKRLVVVQGELLMGHGDAIDAAKTTAIRAGGVAVVPANTHHFEGGRGETIVALIANGPFTTTMVK